MYYEYDPYDNADWWKGEKVIEEVPELTETEKKIAHYEKQSQRHWHSWKTYNSKVYLYHYKQANIKIRKLKKEQALKG